MACITPCLENGKISRVKLPDDCLNGYGSTEFFVFRGINGITDTDYVYYLLNTEYMRQMAVNSMTGASGRQRADLGFIKRIKWTFPDYETQVEISKVLNAYDALIENNIKRIRILENAAKEIYREWFARYRFPGYEAVEFEDGRPKDWEVLKVKDITSLKSGYAFKSEWFVDSGYCVAKIKDIGSVLMDTTDFSFVDPENCAKAKKFILNEGDLTIALTGATIGKISMVPRFETPIYTNQRLGKFFNGDKPIKKLPFLYCFFAQNEITQTIINISNSSSAQPNISPEQIEGIKFLGNKSIIEQFNEITKCYFEEIISLQCKSDYLIKQRNLLLPRLMNGKLSI